MFTEQALRNRQHRLEAEISTPAWRTVKIPPDPDYESDLDVADEVTLCEVLGSVQVQLDLEVVDVDDHGHYSIVYCKAKDGTRKTARVWRDGPPEEGIVGIRIRKKTPRPQPVADAGCVRKLKL